MKSLLIVVSFLLLFYGTLQITWGGAQNDDKNIDKFNFVAAGDFGCGDEPNKTILAMTKKDPELVIALGDLSYNKSASCWIDSIKPLDTNDQSTK